MSNSFDSDQATHSVQPDLGQTCFIYRLSADNKSCHKNYVNPLLAIGYFLIMTLIFLDNIEKNQEVLNTFENMENGVFTLLEQMLHFP